MIYTRKLVQRQRCIRDRVTIVVPFAPGGATDIIGRLLAEALSKRWNATVTVENKAGAGGGIGTEFVARAKPDGLTLLLGTQTGLAVNPGLLPRLGYDVEKDLPPLNTDSYTHLTLSTNFDALIQRVGGTP